MQLGQSIDKTCRNPSNTHPFTAQPIRTQQGSSVAFSPDVTTKETSTVIAPEVPRKTSRFC